jgi:hypothetical protein
VSVFNLINLANKVLQPLIMKFLALLVNLRVEGMLSLL